MEGKSLQKLPPLFDDIGVELDKTCWYTIKVLIYEIVFNAKEHGKAQKCFVQITKNSIAAQHSYFLSAYQRLQPKLISKSLSRFSYKALLIVLSSVSHTAAMSCTEAMNVSATNSRYGNRCL